jgi:hypothetical protein
VLGWSVVFYVIIFSAMAVLLVVAGLMQRSRNRRKLDADSRRPAGHSDAVHRRRRADERAQSRNARRKRH